MLFQSDNLAKKQLRPQHPEIITRRIGEKKRYQLKAWYITENLFQIFDKEHFQKNLLPEGDVLYRNNPQQSVASHVLNQEIEQAVEELRSGQKKPTNFTVLKEKEFCRQDFAGLIVLKSNNYPFVVKLFAENPQSFLQPEKKGFQHGCMSKMTGGLNRYLAGFARIKNMEFAKQLITRTELPMQLDFPRKWFWLPKDNRWFEVKGKHINGKELTMVLPEVYAVIADTISYDKKLSQMRKSYGHTIFKICKQLKFQIDPNMKNFKLERDTGKLVLIDTEPFLTVLGMQPGFYADNYFSMHIQMGMKAIHDCWLTKVNKKQNTY